MKISFIADVHISPLTVFELQALGYQIQRITSFIPANSTDKEIIALALKKDAVIISQDLDFTALIAQQRLNKPSLISLRVGNARPSKITNILKSILPLVEQNLLDGAIISVTDSDFRIRKIPIINN
jgi:predicted nuclease of predicted toxin-antitoxin system